MGIARLDESTGCVLEMASYLSCLKARRWLAEHQSREVAASETTVSFMPKAENNCQARRFPGPWSHMRLVTGHTTALHPLIGDDFLQIYRGTVT